MKISFESNVTFTGLGPGVAIAVLSLGVVGAAVGFAPPSTSTTHLSPEFIEITGVVRDFRERSVHGGHPDFENRPDLGFGHYMGNIAGTLGPDGKPVFTGGGFKVGHQWTDSSGRPIYYRLCDAAHGDVAGSSDGASNGGITSASSFKKWYSDIPGVNLSAPLTIRLNRQSDGSYVFDDKLDSDYASRGGFFPIDGALLGNSAGGPDHNYHFSYELHTRFTYDAAAGQVFKFIGDDDVWVFIDGKLVIDLSGVHAAVEQFVDLNRLGLQHGQTYSLDFFFAERHRTQSNFRIVTNLVLESTQLPSISAGFD